MHLVFTFASMFALLGVFEESADKAADLGINVLKVLGWFVAGFIFMWVAILIGYKSTFGKPCPVGLRKFLTCAAGTICALIAAFILFRDIGTGTGSGTGNPGDTQGKPGAPKPGEVTPDPFRPPEQPKDKGTNENPSDQEKEATIEVAIVGGVADPDKRYYRLGDSSKRISLQELQDELQTLQRDDKKPLKRIIITFDNVRLRETHGYVTQLKSWAEKTAGLKVDVD